MLTYGQYFGRVATFSVKVPHKVPVLWDNSATLSPNANALPYMQLCSTSSTVLYVLYKIVPVHTVPVHVVHAYKSAQLSLLLSTSFETLISQALNQL